MVDGAAPADNDTLSSGDVGRLLRSALASDRLAIVLAVLLAGVVLTIAVLLLSAVIIDRRRRRLPDKLVDCRCVPMRWRHRKTEGSVADVLTMTCCCCCCVDESQRQRKTKPPLSNGDATATTEDVSRSTSVVATTAVRRVGAFENQSV